MQCIETRSNLKSILSCFRFFSVFLIFLICHFKSRAKNVWLTWTNGNIYHEFLEGVQEKLRCEEVAWYLAD